MAVKSQPSESTFSSAVRKQARRIMHHARERRNSNWSTSELNIMAKHFVKVTCKDCGSEAILYSRSTSVIPCTICGATLSIPSGGKADLVGCTVVEALE
jgi:small subunit ribosomal protein S27e